ncbi:hypothetical protein BH23BAC3_BH23BAC3_04410 [soil metagenome]
MTPKNTKQYEEKRLAALYSYNILDTLPEEEFDNLTNLAAEIAGTPVSMINLIDKHRQWTKSNVGLNSDMNEKPRSKSVCQYTIETGEITEINDLSADRRSKAFDYVIGKMGCDTMLVFLY